MIDNDPEKLNRLKLCLTRRGEGSVMLVAIGLLTVLMLAVAVTIMSTTNKYFTAYQWASWQEALQGAESGADIAMGELRKDMLISQGGNNTPAWSGWNMGKWNNSSGYKRRDPATYKPIATDGTWVDNSGGGS